jgi:hypothetical protein
MADSPVVHGGQTLLPGQEPWRWQIREVQPGVAFNIEVPLDGAMITFQWLFDPVSTHRTRITQRIVLSGDNAMSYMKQVQAGFGSNLANGMKRTAEAMATAERSKERQS